MIRSILLGMGHETPYAGTPTLANVKVFLNDDELYKRFTEKWNEVRKAGGCANSPVENRTITLEQLKRKCEEQGIGFPSKAKKGDLLALLSEKKPEEESANCSKDENVIDLLNNIVKDIIQNPTTFEQEVDPHYFATLEGRSEKFVFGSLHGLCVGFADENNVVKPLNDEQKLALSTQNVKFLDYLDVLGMKA